MPEYDIIKEPTGSSKARVAATVVDENISDDGLFVYPNPTDDFVIVKMSLEHRTTVHVSLIDLVGRVVLITANQKRDW